MTVEEEVEWQCSRRWSGSGVGGGGGVEWQWSGSGVAVEWGVK